MMITSFLSVMTSLQLIQTRAVCYTNCHLHFHALALLLKIVSLEVSLRETS